MADHQMDKEVALKRAAPVGRLRKPRAYQPRRQILVPASPGPAGRHAHRFPAVPRRIRLREKRTGLPTRIQPPLKARVGLADIVQLGSTLDHFQQIAGQADPHRGRPCTPPDCAAVLVQFHDDRTQREFVKLVAQGFVGGPLDRQAWDFVTRFENARA